MGFRFPRQPLCLRGRTLPRLTTIRKSHGGAVISNGCGTLVTSRSCLLNPNRNSSHLTQDRFEREFAKFGIDRTIWLEGDRLEPITSGHVDGYVLFKSLNTVLVETFDDRQRDVPIWLTRDVATLEQSVTPGAGKIIVERIKAPRKRYWKFNSKLFAPHYVNAYFANRAVITARFGDVERDEAAVRIGGVVSESRCHHVSN
jgi:agmatine deiminase